MKRWELLKPKCLKVIEDFKPDVIQVFGSEWPFGALAEEINIPIIIHMQGFMNVYVLSDDLAFSRADRLCFQIGNPKSILISLYQMLFYQKHQKYTKSFEQQIMKANRYFFGRTEWDRRLVEMYGAPDSTYFYCPEALRSEIYEEKWEYHKSSLSTSKDCDVGNINKIIKVNETDETTTTGNGNPTNPTATVGNTSNINNVTNTSNVNYACKATNTLMRNLDEKLEIITVSQAGSRKGNEIILRTADILKNDFHLNFTWKVAGSKDAFHLFEKKSGLRHEDLNIELLGFIPASEVAKQLSTSHVYVHPSIADNSPNSLCEAQVVGCPVIAANVGGIPQLVEDGKTGLLYPYNEPHMLAYLLMKLDEEQLRELSANERRIAIERHDPKKIADVLMNTYEEIKKKIKRSIN